MIRKLFKKMVLSQILSAMTVALCLLIDSIIIGRCLGVRAMAAYGLANPVLLAFPAFGSFLSTDIQVVCSKALGNGDEDEVNNCFSYSVTVAAIFSAIGVFFVVFFTDSLVEILGAEPGSNVFMKTKDYLKGFILGAPLFIAAQILVPYLQMAGERIRLVIAVLSMAVVNVTLDLMNVYVFKGGMFGIGLASAISYLIAVLIGVSYFFKKNCIYKYSIKRLKGKMLRKLAVGGVPTVINQLSMVVLVFMINKVMMNNGGSISVAAYSIVSTIATVGYCIGNGISEVSLILAGMAYSESDSKALNEIVEKQNDYAVKLNLLAMLVFVFAAPFLVSLFIDENRYSAKLATEGLRLFAVCLVPCSVNAAFKKYYQAIGMRHFSESISVVQNLLFPGIVVLTLGNFMGTRGVWLNYIIGETLSFLYITVAVHILAKKKLFSKQSYVCVPPEFEKDVENSEEYKIFNKEDVEQASVAAHDFCMKNGMDKKTANYTALCIEEMTMNIVEHGFSKFNDNEIDVRLIKSHDKMIIRIRDNGKSFDPVKFLNMYRGKAVDPTKNIGINMIFSLVKNVNYINTLGLNSLMLEL